jgi:hypothetical protein
MTSNDIITALENHNGGWWVIGCIKHNPPGTIAEWNGIRFTILGPATKQEALADRMYVENLTGMDLSGPFSISHWEKVTCAD